MPHGFVVERDLFAGQIARSTGLYRIGGYFRDIEPEIRPGLMNPYE